MPSSAYAEVLASLYALEAAKGMDFKLERVVLALENLGSPQRRFSAIHIAGTNGKGSVAAMLHAIFAAAGYRVGLYTSPHLISFTERIRIGDAVVCEDEVVELAREIRAAVTVRGIELTFFEFTTVMAFLHFARKGVDLAVIEVGLGGRLDATNVVDPEVSVITTIGLDHQEFLGDTLAGIAREKAGIIKPGRPVIVGRVPVEAHQVIAAIAAEQAAPLYQCERDFSLAGPPALRFAGLGWQVDAIRLGLRGTYQRDNAATALAVAALLRHKFPIGEDAVRAGLATVQWPGRLQVMQTAPLVVFDGAHNVDGVTALTHEIPALVGNRRVHVLFAVMRDKHWHPMIERLGPLAASVTITQALPPRGEDPAMIAQAFERYCRTAINPDPLPALQALIQSVDPGDAIVVTGSLFLIGAVYAYFLPPRTRPNDFSSETAPHPN